MKKIFLNHTNHPSDKWSSEQIAAAEIFGEIIDLPFPAIPPEFGKEEVVEKVAENLKKILSLEPAAVLCQGEFNYTFAMVNELKKNKIPVFAATSERMVSSVVQEDGSSRSVSTFRFVKFRDY